MKKKILYSLITFVLVFSLIGCGKKEEPKKEEQKQEQEETSRLAEPNMKVGLLWFYVPKKEFTYRDDLRGYIYTEDQKKVFIKGDYENDPDNVISIVVYSENVGKGEKQYTDEINAKFTEKDVFYTMKKNSKIIEIYARENYVIGNNVNYAYIVDKAGLIYVINIRGPKDKSSEISKLATDIHSSLLFS